MSDELSATQIRPAQLQIRIRIGTESQIRITDGRDEVNVSGSLSANQLADMRASLRTDLERFSKEVERQIPSLENAIKALRRLRLRGALILNDLFGSEDDALRKAEELCRRACPNWHKARQPETSLAPDMIEVDVVAGDGIPVEILPLFELFSTGKDLDEKIEPDEQVYHLARSFLGFSAIVKRRLGPDPPRLRALDNPAGLPIRLFLHRRIPGAGPVEQYFCDPNVFRCGSPWPDPAAPSSLDQFTETLAGYLWRPEETFAGQPNHPPDQVFHFHCHCDTRHPLPARHELILDTGAFLNGERRVNLDSLRYALYRLRRVEPKNGALGPLVFLNACGSAGITPNGATSFPQLFLDKGMQFLGVIGTEASLPDWFARKFAERFYTRVLEGIEIGTALYQTRWELLRMYKNPLGILYTLYAEPEITLSRIEDSNFREIHRSPEPEHRT
jgi:hypothetical protein